MADTERLEWHKSGHCDSNACVEVARVVQGVCRVVVRDGEDPDGPRLTFTGEQWAAFLDWTRRRTA